MWVSFQFLRFSNRCGRNFSYGTTPRTPMKFGRLVCHWKFLRGYDGWVRLGQGVHNFQKQGTSMSAKFFDSFPPNIG